jgi:hypothetical protein
LIKVIDSTNLRISASDIPKCTLNQAMAINSTRLRCTSNDYNRWQFVERNSHVFKTAKIKMAEGMYSAQFCLCPRGDTPGTSRLYDAIATNCIPIIISDAWIMPFQPYLKREDIFVSVKETDFVAGPELAIMNAIKICDVGLLKKNLEKFAPDLLFSHKNSRVGERIVDQMMLHVGHLDFQGSKPNVLSEDDKIKALKTLKQREETENRDYRKARKERYLHRKKLYDQKHKSSKKRENK